jgi:diguanylate cyclase (GGDEF)-like protein
MNAHIPSLFLMIICISASLAIAIALIARSGESDGTGYWAAALSANTLTYILFIGRGQISDWLSIVLANMLLASAFSLFLQGILQFQKRSLPLWLIWAPVLLEAVVFSWLIPHQNARNIANALILSSQMLWIVGAVLQKRRETVGRGQYFVVTGFLLLVAALAAQGIKSSIYANEVHALLLPSLVQTVTFLVSPVSSMLLAMGLVVMTKERADERNRDMATRDVLTGLFNRRAVMESLSHHIALAKRNGLPMCLLMLDVDHFKYVNDTYGHLSGDRVLRQMAKTLAERTRAQDQVGRFGGEEFLVIVPDTDVDGALTLAETLRTSIENVAFVTEEGKAINVTVSIGVSQLRASDAQQPEKLIASADQALYRAKLGGRNRVEAAQDE